MRLLAAITICVTAFAQQKPEDPAGWGKAKWGMSKADIAKAFPDASEFYNHATGRTLGLRHFEIGSQKLTIMFQFADKETDGLESVFMEAEKETEGRQPGPETVRFLYDLSSSELLSLLRDKYGTPLETTDDTIPDVKTHSWQWTLQTTKITLTFADNKNPKYDYCILTYGKRKLENPL